MSHFVVYAIEDYRGDHTEKMERYCEEPIPEYSEFYDRTEEIEEHFDSLKDEDLAEYESMEDFAMRYYGYTKHRGKWGYFHNPEAKWDWYVEGGRWDNELKLKSGMKAEQYEDEGIDVNEQDDGSMYTNSAPIKYIDFESKSADEREYKSKQFDLYREYFEEIEVGFKDLDELRKEMDEEDALKIYRDQPFFQKRHDLRSDEGITFSFTIPSEYYYGKGTWEERKALFMKEYEDQAYAPYAFLLEDGEWLEKGRMGWFGMSDDHETQGEWNARSKALILEQDPELWITVLDCHI